MGQARRKKSMAPRTAKAGSVMSIEVVGDLAGAWPDLAADPGHVIEVREGPLAIGAMEGATSSGQHALVMRIPLPNGYTVLVLTSLRLTARAIGELMRRYGQEA
jgi:hypothetical protein